MPHTACAPKKIMKWLAHSPAPSPLSALSALKLAVVAGVHPDGCNTDGNSTPLTLYDFWQIQMTTQAPYYCIAVVSQLLIYGLFAFECALKWALWSHNLSSPSYRAGTSSRIRTPTRTHSALSESSPRASCLPASETRSCAPTLTAQLGEQERTTVDTRHCQRCIINLTMKL